MRTNEGGKIGASTTEEVVGVCCLWCLCTGVKVKAACTRNLSNAG